MWFSLKSIIEEVVLHEGKSIIEGVVLHVV